MKDFKYVPKKEVKEEYLILSKIIKDLQIEVSEYFTFQYHFVGSYKDNLITYDEKSNTGFDFDVDLEINDEEENYTPFEIRNIVKKSLDKIVRKYGYDFCEDSTRVLTIKFKNIKKSKILHSCDFALVYYCKDGRKKYIRFNKSNNKYTWEFQGKGFDNLDDKKEWLKQEGLWKDFRDYYLYKKNINTDKNKKSCSIRAEAIKEICEKNGYYD